MYLAGDCESVGRQLAKGGGYAAAFAFRTKEEALRWCANAKGKFFVLDVGMPDRCDVVETRIARLNEDRSNMVMECRVWPDQSWEGAMGW